MSERDRAYRLHQERRAKAKASKKAKDRDMPTDSKTVGRMASVHGALCSCEMCGNPRKYFGAKAVQEAKADESFDEDLTNIDGSDVVND